ncbi:MAG TPA: ATP-binding protein [Polyangiaceae bacterium]|nr:ATP-binding protein [Polyangiaceae bacterium]
MGPQWARVQPGFTAGFFIAWAPVYLVAAALSFWTGRRSKSSPELMALGGLFVTFAIQSGAAGAYAAHGVPSDSALFRVADAARLIAPAILLHYAVLSDRSRFAQKLVLPAYGVASAAAVHALWEAGSSRLDVAALSTVGVPAHPSRSDQLAEVVSALLIIATTVLLGRTFATQKRTSPLPFLGACGLAVAIVFDAIASAIGTTTISLSGFGFSGFTIILFAGQIVDAAQRRDRLLDKTHDLRKKSEDLGRSFKELRAAQNDLVRKEQLAAIGELSAVIAHEVRNPLAVIQNAVATMKRTGTDETTRKTLLEILSEETSRLNQLVGDLLHYARPLSVEPEAIQLREIVDKAVSPLSTRIDLHIVVTEVGTVPKIGGDPLLLRQAIENVVNNAAQAMQQGGQMTIELSHAEEEGGVYLTVRDDGEGMDTVVRKRALDPFFTTRPSGTGLGLAIVARVVDAHAGRLTIKSERGSGTEVIVFLPISPTTAVRSSRSRFLPPQIEPFSSDDNKSKEQA